MIEFCSKRRIVCATLLLISISIVIIFIEHRIPLHANIKLNFKNGNLSTCTTQNFEVSESCRKCTDFLMKFNEACLDTGYIEKVTCQSASLNEIEVIRPCPKSFKAEENKFIAFEACALVIGLISYSVVNKRKKRLETLLREKVNKQIAAGV